MLERLVASKTPYFFGFAMVQGPRPRIEDAAAIIDSRFAVFDGIGGHGDGDQASMLAAGEFVRGSQDLLDLRQTLFKGHWKIIEDIDKKSKAGTTAAAIQIERHKVRLIWSGDSRIYLYRPRLRGETARLAQLTKDHGVPDRPEVVTQALGARLDPSEGEVTRRPGDVFLLTTDGVHDFVSEWQILAILESARTASPQAAAAALVAAALERGTTDNATALVVAA